jgi:phage shock protein A
MLLVTAGKCLVVFMNAMLAAPQSERRLLRDPSPKNGEAVAEDFNQISQKLLQEVARLQAEERALQTKVHAVQLTEQELTVQLAELQDQIARKRAGLDTLNDHCDAMMAHAEKTVNDAVAGINRIFGDLGRSVDRHFPPKVRAAE